MLRTTTQTALCIIPPEGVWTPIQAIRSRFDKAYPRWMPHINLIYPFVSEENFEAIKQRLEVILKGEKPFAIRFDSSSFHHFKQRDDECTYHLQPTNSTDIVQLQKLIQNQLNGLPKQKRAFQAHLTLGQTTTSNIDHVLADLKTQWQAIEFPIDRIYMISRENHPENRFVIKHEILLLDQVDELSSIRRLNPMVEQSSTTKNYLCLILPNEFTARLIRLFENTSFQPIGSFRIILADYETNPVNTELRSKLESTTKFTLIFEQNALHFDEATSNLYLLPTNVNVLDDLNVLDRTKYDARLTLGQVHRDDFEKVNDRFSKNCPAGGYQLVIDRMHLTETDGRFKFIFRLKNS